MDMCSPHSLSEPDRILCLGRFWYPLLTQVDLTSNIGVPNDTMPCVIHDACCIAFTTAKVLNMQHRAPEYCQHAKTLKNMRHGMHNIKASKEFLGRLANHFRGLSMATLVPVCL